MAGHSFQKGELLLVALKLLQGEPMSERELLTEFERAVAKQYRWRPAEVFGALEALEAEGLLELDQRGGVPCHRLTPEGEEALDRRNDSTVLRWLEQRANPPEHLVDSVEDELQQISILFTDIVGSTRLLDQFGDDAAHQLRRRHFALLRRLLREHGGREVKNLGDGLMVAFENAPAAVRCACAMRREVALDEDPLQLRIGVASGEVLCEDQDYFGRPVIVARRLCDAAGADDVLISEAVAGSISPRGSYQLEPRGPLFLKGLSEPVTAGSIRPLALGV